MVAFNGTPFNLSDEPVVTTAVDTLIGIDAAKNVVQVSMPLATTGLANVLGVGEDGGIRQLASADQKISRATQGVFWTAGADEPFIHRMRDRVFIGNATGMGSSRSNTNTTWVPDTASGANWIPRDSQFVVMTDNGSLAISGGSRVSDGAAASVATIGVSGFVINDATVSTGTAWAFYADIQHEATVGTNSYGMEVAAKNKTAFNTASTPYAKSSGVYGTWLAGGGDDQYGGAPTYPANTGIMFLKSRNSLAAGWNVGINFDKEALAYTGSFAPAVRMAKGHTIEWWAPDQTVGAFISSTVDVGTAGISLQFDDNTVSFVGLGSAGVLFRTVNVASAVNWIQTTNAATGGLPSLVATGTDTNVSLYVQPKGTGVLFFASGDGTAKLRVNNTGLGFFTTSPVARKTGWGVATGTATRTTYDTTTITLPQLAERVKALIDDLHSTAGYGLITT